MAKSQLTEPFNTLETEIIETLIAGHKEWRPDLAYPESHSDMQGAVRGLLRMFEVKRRSIAIRLEYPCPHCDGLGYFRTDSTTIGGRCTNCKHGKIQEG